MELRHKSTAYERLSLVDLVKIPGNPALIRPVMNSAGHISNNDLDGTTIKAAKIYKTAGLEIKDTLRKCKQENEGCQYPIPRASPRRPCEGDERIGLARGLTAYKRITVHTVSFLIAFLAVRPSFQIVLSSERRIDRGTQVF